MTVLITAAAVACGDSGPAEPSDLLIATDSPTYTAVPIGYGQVVVKVVTRYQNPTSQPIKLDRCFPTTPYPIYSVGLVTPKNDEGAAYDPSWACVGHDKPIVVAPGETRVDTLTLHAPNAFDNSLGRSLGALQGTFRVSYGGRASNEFTIRLPADGVVPFVPRDLTAAIQTDSLIVRLKFNPPFFHASPLIHVTMYNPRPDTSFIVNCGGSTGLYLEKQAGAVWNMAWSPNIPACLSQAIIIPPGGHYETSVDLSGGAIGSNFSPKFMISDIPGVYRLVWTEIVGSFTFQPTKWGPPIPIEYRRSNAFAIVVDP